MHVIHATAWMTVHMSTTHTESLIESVKPRKTEYAHSQQARTADARPLMSVFIHSFAGDSNCWRSIVGRCCSRNGWIIVWQHRPVLGSQNKNELVVLRHMRGTNTPELTAVVDVIKDQVHLDRAFCVLQLERSFHPPYINKC